MNFTLKYNHWSFKFWPLSRFEAITLPWGIYFKSPASAISAKLLRHEIAHMQQIERLGASTFLIGYVVKWMYGVLKYRSFWKAYEQHPYELEARWAEKYKVDYADE